MCPVGAILVLPSETLPNVQLAPTHPLVILPVAAVHQARLTGLLSCDTWPTDVCSPTVWLVRCNGWVL